MTHTYDVAVIGAGIAGSVMAKSLAENGFRTVIFDRKAFPRHKVCGEFLSPESLTMLSKLGLHEIVASLQPRSIDRTRLILRRGQPLEIPLPGTAMGVSRYQLDEALHQEAMRSGTDVRTETTVISVKSNDQGFRVETKHHGAHNVYHVRAVLGAWGANGLQGLHHHQHQRDAAPIKSSHIGVKSHYTEIDMEPVVELYFFHGGYLGISPIEEGQVNVAALLERKAFQQRDKSILGFIEEACRRHPKLGRKLGTALPVIGTQAAVAPVSLTREPLAWDTFPLLGDAASMLPPLCGDGMSMALRSAMLCVPLATQYLKGEIDLAEWEISYTQAVNLEFKGPLKWGHLLQGVFGVPLLPQILLAAAQFTPKLAHRFVQATRLKEIEF